MKNVALNGNPHVRFDEVSLKGAMRCALFVAFVAGLTIRGAFAAAVGPLDSLVKDVESGSVEETETLLFDPAAKGVEKTGAGSYVLPVDKVASRSDLAVTVRGGGVVLKDEGGAAPTVSRPACLADAALYLDATTLAGDDSAVSKWLDEREGNTDAGRYYRLCQGTSAAQPTTVTRNGKKWVYFGGKASGRYALLNTTANAALKLTTVCHAFVLLDLDTSYGFVFGVSQNTYPFFHPGAYSGDLSSTYSSAAQSDPGFYAGRTFLDGRQIDAAKTSVRSGVQLLEWEVGGNRKAVIHNMFNDRDMVERRGGDYVGAVVLFTNKLTSAQRMEVEEFLLQSWKGKGHPSAVNVRTAVGTSLTLESSLTGSEKVLVSGTGTVVQKGASELRRSDAVDGPFAGAWKMLAGSLTAESGDVTLEFDGGSGYTMAKDDYGVTTVSKVQAEPGAITKTGTGSLRLRAIPAGVMDVDIQGGSLSLAAVQTNATGTAAVADPVIVTVANGGFETWSAQDYCSGTSKNGWTFSAGDFHVIRNGGNLQTTYSMRLAPEGKNYLALKFGSSTAKGATAVLSTTSAVNFPADGRYEFSCWSGARPTHPGVSMQVELVKDSVVTPLTRIYGYADFTRERHLTPFIAKGDYTLRITFTNVLGTEKWGAIDDISFRYVPVEPDETVCDVPNGGFEFIQPASLSKVDAATTADGWTLSAPTAADPDVKLVHRNMSGTALHQFVGGDAERGSMQLILYGTAGSATTASFVPPKGAWRVRCRAAHWGQVNQPANWNSKAASLAPSLKFTATVGGESVALGTVADLDNTVLAAVQSPKAFSADGTQAVTLKFEQTKVDSGNYAAGLVLDAVELVRDENLVADGGFEGSEWTCVNNRFGASTMSKAVQQSPTANAYCGRTTCEGAKALYLVQIGAAYQDVVFPEAGLYRLSFRARGRNDYYAGGDVPNMSYAALPVKALLIASGSSETNEIYRTTPIVSTNFVEYAGLFKVPAAGTYTFGLQGCEVSADKEAFVDLVSIVRAETADHPDLPEDVTIRARLADGQKLRLDYPGTATVRTLKVNGRSLHGTVSAATYPDYVTGPGSVNVTYRPGVMIIVK